jgi:hypothetical protein
LNPAPTPDDTLRGIKEAQMIKTATYVFAVLAVGTVAIAWSQQKAGPKAVQQVETISPEKLTPGRGQLPELKFNDMSFVQYDTN